MNRLYHIRRENMLSALGLPDKIPVGRTDNWSCVRVRTGYWRPSAISQPAELDDTNSIVLDVRLMPNGVANRIQVRCPKCETWMRFCGLQQHVDTKKCVKTRIARATSVGLQNYRWSIDPKPEVV